MKKLNRAALCLTIVLANVNMPVYSASGRMASKFVRPSATEAAIGTASSYWLWKQHNDWKNQQGQQAALRRYQTTNDFSDAQMESFGNSFKNVPNTFNPFRQLPTPTSVSNSAWNTGLNWYRQPEKPSKILPSPEPTRSWSDWAWDKGLNWYRQ